MTKLAEREDYDKVWEALYNEFNLLNVCAYYTHPCTSKYTEAENINIPNWKVVPVWGKIGEDRFFKMLKNGMFPINQQLRHMDELKYCTLRDNFHDVIGHLGFLHGEQYSDMMKLFGIVYTNTSKPVLKKVVERLYWAVIEFGLIGDSIEDYMVLGAGLVSSSEERSVITADKIKPYNLFEIAQWDYDPNGMQDRYYIINSLDEVIKDLGKLI